MAGNYRTVIKRFSDNYFSVTQLKHMVSGVRNKLPDSFIGPPKYLHHFPLTLNLTRLAEDREKEQEKKLKESLVRSRTKIFEIAMCNDWEFFGTFTIDPNKYDRYQLGDFYKAFSQYIQNLNKRNGYNIKYLLIPETHKDGAWHLHGMFMGIPEKMLLRFSFNRKLPRYIRNQLKKHRKIFDWPGYRHRFGFCDLEPIRKKEACCKYIVKYITKDLDRSVREGGSKVYYCSQGLNRPTVVYEGEDAEKIIFPHHSNVWIDRKDFFDFASALEYSSVKFFDSFLSAGLDEDTIDRILSA